MRHRLLRWAAAGARRFALALAHALGPGAAALALGRRRLGAALMAAYLAVVIADPVLAAWCPPLTWGAWRWHLAQSAAWIALISLPAAAYLLGWERGRAARLRPSALPSAVALGAALFWATGLAARGLGGSLDAPRWTIVRSADNAAAPNFPEGKGVVVMLDWWTRHQLGHGDLVHLEAADLPPERAAFAGISRAVALPGDTVQFVDGTPVVNGFIARRRGVVLPRSWPDEQGRGERYRRQLFDEELGEGWPSHRVIAFMGAVAGAERGPSGMRQCLVSRDHVVVLRDNRSGSRFEQDSRAGYLGGDLRNDCPVMVPMEAVRHRPTILSGDPHNREYGPRELR